MKSSSGIGVPRMTQGLSCELSQSSESGISRSRDRAFFCGRGKLELESLSHSSESGISRLEGIVKSIASVKFTSCPRQRSRHFCLVKTEIVDCLALKFCQRCGRHIGKVQLTPSCPPRETRAWHDPWASPSRGHDSLDHAVEQAGLCGVSEESFEVERVGERVGGNWLEGL